MWETLKKTTFKVKVNLLNQMESSTVGISRKEKCMDKESTMVRSLLILGSFLEGNLLGRESTKICRQMIYSKGNS